MTRIKDENDLVAPGDLVFEGTEVQTGHGVYVQDDKIYSEYVGAVRYNNSKVEVVPMSGRYIPEEGDIVIGEVVSIGYSNWRVELSSPYQGMMKIDTAVDEYVDLDEDDLTDYYDVGDAIVIKVTNVTEGMDVNLSMLDKRCKKLRGGRVIEISPSKVPRVIGSKGTMVKQIKEKTGSNIIVGQNGLIWIQGGDANTAARAVKKVEEEAHTSGLTEKIGEWLDQEVNR